MPLTGISLANRIIRGTWTPVLTFATVGDLNVVYSTQTGDYIQEGRFFRCRFTIVTSTFTHTTASGGLRVTGLPVTVGASWRNTLAEWQGITKANYTTISIDPTANQTRMTFTASGSAQSTSAVAVADVPTGGTVALRGTAEFTV